MKVLVHLSFDEVEYAAKAGVMRNIRAMQKERRPNQPERPEWQQKWWQSDITGCLGEMAVAKMFGVKWEDTENDVNGFDVLDYQVRTIENPGASLRVRLHDKNTDVFILAQVHRRSVLIHGYSTGALVKQFGTQEFPRCWTLPKEELYSVTDLPHPIYFTTTVQPHTK